MSAIHNERTKLTANWLNAMASGVIITGVVAPSIAVLFQFSIGIGYNPLLLASASGIWLFCGLHCNGLREKFLEAPVSWFTIYALFGMPLVALGIGVGVRYFTAPGNRHHIHPGE